MTSAITATRKPTASAVAMNVTITEIAKAVVTSVSLSDSPSPSHSSTISGKNEHYIFKKNYVITH